MKSEPNRLIPRKPTENLELLIIDYHLLVTRLWSTMHNRVGQKKNFFF